jgi:hypothetical protein
MGSQGADSVDDGSEARESALYVIIRGRGRVETEIVAYCTPKLPNRLPLGEREAPVLDIGLANGLDQRAGCGNTGRRVGRNRCQGAIELFIHGGQVPLA